jgi:hypothetical protein
VLSTGTNILFGGSGTNVLDLTGLYETYTTKLNADGSDTIADTRTGTPDGTDIVHNFQDFQFAEQPGRKIYPPRCERCGGRGRIPTG